jgi:hypothetical protein
MIRAIKLIFDVKSFRSEHHIAPQIELITADDIDNGYVKFKVYSTLFPLSLHCTDINHKSILHF